MYYHDRSNCYIEIEHCVHYKDEHCLECSDSFVTSHNMRSCEFICDKGDRVDKCTSCENERTQILSKKPCVHDCEDPFKTNCFVYIDHCAVYKDQHCEECLDSYELSKNKKSCKHLCQTAHKPGVCKECVDKHRNVLIQTNG